MPETRNASLALVVLCAVILPALAGLIVGGVSAPEPKAPQGHLVSGPSVTVMAPRGWRRAENAPAVPGLPLKGGIALAPGGDPAEAGLLAGRVTTQGHGPLPESLLRRLRSDLRTEVVGVGTWDGYRYDDLRVAGFAPRLVVYAVPTTEGSTAVACYASARAAAQMSTCERIARSLEILSGPESGMPEVNGAYARAVRQTLGRLDASRVAQRNVLKASPSPGRAAAATNRLSLAYANAARTLSAAAPPDAAGGAHAGLIKRLWGGRDAYRRLSLAARGEDEAAWNAGRRTVRQAETALSTSLGDLGALGYGRAA